MRSWSGAQGTSCGTIAHLGTGIARHPVSGPDPALALPLPAPKVQVAGRSRPAHLDPHCPGPGLPTQALVAGRSFMCTMCGKCCTGEGEVRAGRATAVRQGSGTRAAGEHGPLGRGKLDRRAWSSSMEVGCGDWAGGGGTPRACSGVTAGVWIVWAREHGRVAGPECMQTAQCCTREEEVRARARCGKRLRARQPGPRPLRGQRVLRRRRCCGTRTGPGRPW